MIWRKWCLCWKGFKTRDLCLQTLFTVCFLLCSFFSVSVLQEQASRLGVPAAILAAKNAATNLERICQAPAGPSQGPLLSLDQRVGEKVYVSLMEKTALWWFGFKL